MVCHDLAGGYKEDKWNHGYSKSSFTYRFLHWECCDIFIYFSHSRIAMPPYNHINLAHSFGTKVLGTFITEGDIGIHFRTIISVFSIK